MILKFKFQFVINFNFNLILSNKQINQHYKPNYYKLFIIINNSNSSLSMHSPRNSQSNKKSTKKIYQKYISVLSQKQIQQKIKSLNKKLSRQQICKQHKLIANMNPRLEFQLVQLMKFQQFKNVKLQDAIKIVNGVTYLTWVCHDKNKNQIQAQQKNIIYNNFTKQLQKNSKKDKQKQQNQKEKKYVEPHFNYNEQSYLKLTYEASQRTIILTGITKPFIQRAIKQFISSNSTNSSNNYKKNQNHHYQQSLCSIVGKNDFWVAVQTDSQITASLFKRFVRNRKRSCDQQKIFTYKQEKKRVRIVTQGEDFYTLLVDAMTQKKNSQFLKRLVNPKSGLFPSICLRDSRHILPFDNQQYQSSLKKINKVLYFPIIVSRNQSKQTESTLDEVFSQDFSKTSQFLQSLNSMNDLIEKTDFGIQAQSLGVGTQEQQFIESQTTIEALLNAKNSSQKFESNSNQKQLVNSQRVIQRKNSNDSDNLMKFSVQKQNKNNQKEQPQQNQEEQEEGQLISQMKTQQKLTSDKLLEKQNNNGLNYSPIKNIEQNHNSKENIQASQKQDIYQIEKSHDSSPTQQQSSKSLLFSVRQPQLPSKFLTLNFQTYIQTENASLNYTKMKRLQIEYKKRCGNRLKLSIPEQFRQISQQQRNRGFFFQNIWKSMERKSQRKQNYMDYFY